jgi:hypothetical protein
MIAGGIAVLALLAAGAGVLVGAKVVNHPGSSALKLAKSKQTKAQAEATVTCDLLSCASGKVGQPCSVGNYPGIIVQAAPTELACDPSPSSFPSATVNPPPSPAPAPNPAPVGQAQLTSTCAIGWFPGAQGAVFQTGPPQTQDIGGTSYPPIPAYQLTLSNPSSATADITGFAVVFYDTGSNELGSDRENVSETFLTPGQSLTWTEETSAGRGNASIPDGSATCSLVQWYTGQ